MTDAQKTVQRIMPGIITRDKITEHTEAILELLNDLRIHMLSAGQSHEERICLIDSIAHMEGSFVDLIVRSTSIRDEIVRKDKMESEAIPA